MVEVTNELDLVDLTDELVLLVLMGLTGRLLIDLDSVVLVMVLFSGRMLITLESVGSISSVEDLSVATSESMDPERVGVGKLSVVGATCVCNSSPMVLRSSDISGLAVDCGGFPPCFVLVFTSVNVAASRRIGKL